MFDYYNLRPAAFFSETTWYAEYLVFVVILMFMKVNLNRQYRLLWLLPLFILGLIFSATRNAYLSLVVYLCLSFIFLISRPKLNTKLFINKHLFYVLLLSLVIVVSLNQYILNYLDMVVSKFLFTNASISRMDSFRVAIQNINSSLFIGHGFYWDESVYAGPSSIGAKSFNLFLMILHIFGLAGFIPFIFLIIKYYVRAGLDYLKSQSMFIKYSIIIFSAFLVMSMFAPIHQYGFGMYIVAYALYLQYRGNQWQKT